MTGLLAPKLPPRAAVLMPAFPLMARPVAEPGLPLLPAAATRWQSILSLDRSGIRAVSCHHPAGGPGRRLSASWPSRGATTEKGLSSFLRSDAEPFQPCDAARAPPRSTM